MVVTSQDAGVEMDIADFFTFDVPGARFMPAYKNRTWDGKKNLYNRYKKTMYVGLLSYLVTFAEERKYSIEINGFPTDDTQISPETVGAFCTALCPHANDSGKLVPITPDDYQINAVTKAINDKRLLIVSPTGSGKSLIIYLMIRYALAKTKGKVLIVVPTTSLVEQMYKDFSEYSAKDPLNWNVEDYIHRIYAGKDKTTEKRVIVTTWQSIFRKQESWFYDFSCVIGDEAHTFQSQSLTVIMEKCKYAKYRIGTTGSLNESKVHKLVLQGLFGRVFQTVTTNELIKRGRLAQLKITCLNLRYSDETKKIMKQAAYDDEIRFLIEHNKRNAFISQLSAKLKGNTLVLFRLVEHGKTLHKMVKSLVGEDRKIFLVYGQTETEIRESVRSIVEKEKDAIIIASYGVFSTGINIRNLHNIIFASPYKSLIKVTQSIGRGLRKSETKTDVKLYDISDNLQYKSHKNHTLNHFLFRVKLYNEEKFDYSLVNVNLEG
jgi:superfamily II DNA or RNA helicase